MSKGIRKCILFTAAFFLLIVGIQSKDKPKPKEETGPFFAAVEFQSGLQKGHVQAGHSRLKAVILDRDLLVRRMLKKKDKAESAGFDSVRLTAKKKPTDNGRILEDLKSQVKKLRKKIMRVEKDLASSKTDSKTNEALTKMRKSLIYRLMTINRRIAELEKEEQAEPQASEKSDPVHLAGTEVLRPPSSARLRSASGPIHTLGTGSISGTVTDEGDVGIEKAFIQCIDLDGNVRDAVYSGSDGSYTISGLDMGSYRILVQVWGEYGNFAPEWYSNKATEESADAVAVTDGLATTGINVQLAAGGIISGTITDEFGNPLEGIYVKANAEGNNGRISNYGYTNSSGVYQVQGLATGNHKVLFIDYSSNYVSEWYNDQADFDSADAVSVTAGSTTSGINAQLGQAGAISGTVTNGSGTGIENIEVDIYNASGDYVAYGNTDSTGVYEAKGFPTESYKVLFYADDTTGNYLSEWYNDQADFDSADAVSVTAGSTTSGINAQLAAGGAITGTVTNGSGSGIENVRVRVYDSSNNYLTYDDTDPVGAYELKSLPLGNYKVYFYTGSASGNYISEWYDDNADIGSADSVLVTAGSTTSGINAQLAAGGAITGTVTNGSGAGIADVEVDIYDSYWDFVNYGYTNSSGVYEVKSLPNGTYKVNFWTQDASESVVSEWYDDKADFDSANSVLVTAGSTTSGISAQLAPAGTISGRVTNASGSGIYEVFVDVYNPYVDRVGYGWTDSNGDFTIRGIPPGERIVLFDPWYNNSYYGGLFAYEFYNDKASFPAADPVTSQVGVTTSGIDAVLETEGKITGRVTDTGGNPIEGADVEVFDDSWLYWGGVSTNAAGDFEIDGLTTYGKYRVSYASGSLYQYYDGKLSWLSADDVAVTKGSTTPNINATLGAESWIMGTVKNGSAAAIEGLRVQARDMANNGAASAYTDLLGQYTLSVMPGTWRVLFEGASTSVDYAAQWYNAKSTFLTADLISVDSGATASGINATLAPGGRITGSAKNGTGKGIGSIRIRLQDADDKTLLDAYTISSGAYTIAGVPPGTYKVFFDPDPYQTGIYKSAWYNGKSNFAGANPVTVAAGATTSGIDAVLAESWAVNAQIVLSKSALYFGGVVGGVKTMAQELRIQNGGTGTMAWEFSGLPTWLTITPSSGSGNTLLLAAVNTTGLAKGTYNGSVKAISPNAMNSPQTLAVTLKVYAASGTSAPFGFFDTPLGGSTVRGSIPVSGWALDDIEVTKVEVRRGRVTGDPPGAIGADGLIYVGDATFVEGARPDVEAARPGYPLNYRAGWGYMLLTYGLPNHGNGTFVLHAVAFDRDGHRKDLGTKTIVSDNAHNTKPFGAIDTPGQGGATSGNPYVNFGWVLTPPPAMVPIDGSTIWLWIDSVQVGHPTYNQFRVDVHDAYPDYLNADGAVGFYYINTTAYANGMHTIGWSATDDHSQAEGMGSRFFWVFNGSSGAGAAGLSAQATSGLTGAQENTAKANARNDISVIASPDGLQSRDSGRVQNISPSGGIGSLVDLAGIPADVLSPIYIRTGIRDAGPHQVANPDAYGIRNIMIEETDRVVISLDSPEKLPSEGRDPREKRASARDSVELAGAVRWSGYLVVGNELRPLPIGSTLDAARGVFFWQPGPGFLGTYSFIFVDGRTGLKKSVAVTIRPKSFPKGR